MADVTNQHHKGEHDLGVATGYTGVSPAVSSRSLARPLTLQAATGAVSETSPYKLFCHVCLFIYAHSSLAWMLSW